MRKHGERVAQRRAFCQPTDQAGGSGASALETASSLLKGSFVARLELDLVIPSGAELRLRALHLEIRRKALDLARELAPPLIAAARDHDGHPGRQVGQEVSELGPS